MSVGDDAFFHLTSDGALLSLETVTGVARMPAELPESAIDGLVEADRRGASPDWRLRTPSVSTAAPANRDRRWNQLATGMFRKVVQPRKRCARR
jgi:hypothetical protein